ncbi:MAG: hypothetical protein NTW87_07770 [Planctomycetota bacterium]|nr:hypothetical protein [Planctomycetota bacterium]
MAKTLEQKPDVPEVIATVMDLQAAEEKLKQFIKFLDRHKTSRDRSYRLLNTDLRNAAARLIVEIEGLEGKVQELVEAPQDA